MQAEKEATAQTAVGRFPIEIRSPAITVPAIDVARPRTTTGPVEKPSAVCPYAESANPRATPSNPLRINVFFMPSRLLTSELRFDHMFTASWVPRHCGRETALSESDSPAVSGPQRAAQ